MYKNHGSKKYIRNLGIYFWSYICCLIAGRASRLRQSLMSFFYHKFFDKRDAFNGSSSFTAICTYMTHPPLAPPTVVSLNS